MFLQMYLNQAVVSHVLYREHVCRMSSGFLFAQFILFSMNPKRACLNSCLSYSILVFVPANYFHPLAGPNSKDLFIAGCKTYKCRFFKAGIFDCTGSK